MARLQTEVGRIDFLGVTNFLTPNPCHEMLRPLDPKKISLQIPAKFSCRISLQKNQENSPTSCNPPDLLQESLGPFGPEVSQECPPGCLQGPSGPGLRSVQKVSRECPRSVKKVSRTLRFHSRDTLWTLRSPGPEGPRRHPEGHPKGHSCSSSGGLQPTSSCR